MAATIQAFGNELRAFMTTVEGNFGDQLIDMTMRLTEMIIQGTPVDTGRAANSWNISLDSPDDSMQEEGFFGGYGEALSRLQRQRRRLLGLRRNPFRVIHINNSVPYVVYLEFGTPKMQAFGMVRGSIEALQAELDAEAGA